ncbi:MAG: hydroxymethylglutaryl-CoA lyase [Candidatus Eremiobacteraeota bacterium]|nr:hydroxymethylglutaryl-CoA lyase [Candidatus Eremiobacteraeota bacterium]
MSALSLSNLPSRVKIVEVGPRDGLQNEKAQIPTADKIRYIDMLSDAGLPVIEATSFVSPKAIPQLADADEVFRSIRKRDGVTYLVLVPNERGLDRAIGAGVRAIAVFTAASQTFTKRNINMTIEESLSVFRGVVRRARAEGMWIRGYISTCFGCPYEGEVKGDDVAAVAEALAEMGTDEISIGDTIGVATPNQVVEIAALLQERMPVERLAMHFHDTRGTALANIVAALQMQIAIFDSSSGGLGGCPYAPGASGNVATEDVLYLLHGMGIETGVDLEKVRLASRTLAGALDHELTSKTFRALEAAGSG